MTSSRLALELRERGSVSAVDARGAAVNPDAPAYSSLFDTNKWCADLKSSNQASMKTFSISLPHELLKVTRLKKRPRIR